MKGFRISIVGVMTLVAVAAADCLVLRWFFVRGSESILLTSGLLPLVNVLAVGMWLGLRGLVARRRCPSFLLGLQVFGWAAAAGYTIVCVLPSAFELVIPYLGVVLAPVETLLGRLGLVYDDSSVCWRLLSYACSSAALSAPLLVFGLVGGYLTHRFEIWLAGCVVHVRGALSGDLRLTRPTPADPVYLKLRRGLIPVSWSNATHGPPSPFERLANHRL